MKYSVFEVQLVLLFVVVALLPFIWLLAGRIKVLKLPLILVIVGLLYLGVRLGISELEIIMCGQQVKHIARQIAAYQEVEDEKLPTILKQLTPKLMKEIPRCPAAKSDTYSPSYRPNNFRHTYSLYCSGQHHGLIRKEKNYPSYDSTKNKLSF